MPDFKPTEADHSKTEDPRYRHAFVEPAPVAPEAPRRRELTQDERYACAADCVHDPDIGETLTQDEQTGFNAGYRAALAYAATRGYKPDHEPRCGHRHNQYGCKRIARHDGMHAEPWVTDTGLATVWTDDGSAPFHDLAPEGKK